jgi:uncharacterized membrane protein YtjA (UPF0391 family)
MLRWAFMCLLIAIVAASSGYYGGAGGALPARGFVLLLLAASSVVALAAVLVQQHQRSWPGESKRGLPAGVQRGERVRPCRPDAVRPVADQREASQRSGTGAAVLRARGQWARTFTLPARISVIPGRNSVPKRNGVHRHPHDPGRARSFGRGWRGGETDPKRPLKPPKPGAPTIKPPKPGEPPVKEPPKPTEPPPPPKQPPTKRPTEPPTPETT